MSKIKILPENLSNKIAAGEVVERPSSVVKELVENALDADSTQIVIDIEQGGRSLIRVADNGTGMSRDDALLAIERYATSKIAGDEDLFKINTLGFRGEAIPSIAAVSRFNLTTQTKDDAAGTELVIDGGTIKKVADVGAPVGTMITVKQLFYNTPARRKFLKTVGTEMGHIVDAVTAIALAWPHVQFRLTHNKQTLKNWPGVHEHADRVIEVLGKSLQNELHRIEMSVDNVQLAGWLSSPNVKRSTSRGIYVYVNNRYVRDRVIQHALFTGYGERLMKGQFPLAVLFVRVPFDQVDVNVHPTKHEVRFSRQSKVHDEVAGAVARTLRKADERPWGTTAYPKRTAPSAQRRMSEPVATFGRTGGGAQKLIDDEHVSTTTTDSRQQPDREAYDHPARQRTIWKKSPLAELRVIGQCHDTYLLCESADGLVMIDQHAAHERILFEQLKRRSLSSKKAAQRRLVPETVELGYRETAILEDMIPDLRGLGLDIEPFGAQTFVIKSVPVLLENKEITPLVVEIVEKMAAIGFTPGLEKAIDECLVLMACHGAIRANQKLSEAEIKGLLQQLDQCDHSSHCPHGRPIWIQWSVKALEKSFKRTA